ncbi:MBOAT, membrane-bound O-acyltransferase family-domain-containing protein [Desarmillaria tabescens]|uniref:MBOAT, membrane-bound O-acyltransferase family-domain-containing protein n=1 Tax=Armillaria tabescens TaxID=1929756 RepID=A0AA39N8C0_ARMTA|nr:MBOAT, membrane-bound O-acyltransferase family-domain-containing protein [Desarmillaria tabescens]KAK0460900.1 MBOAT, membrane-bound O-acyltransferase family-domain-containing protein [Desarmillaria tabescens]
MLPFPPMVRHKPPPSFNITSLTVSIPTKKRTPSTTPSRWSTLEFRIYLLIIALAVPWMAWVVIRISLPTHPAYHLFSDRLSRGWLFGWPVDNWDAQYRSFRNNVPILAAVAGVHALLTYFVPVRLRLRLNLVFSLIFNVALHGTSTLKILAILSLNYALRAQHPSLTWTDWEGVYPRWYISFNITMLRLVSFNMDYHVATTTPKPDSHPPHAYTFPVYLTYALFAPLYIAGPIIPFNDFLAQIELQSARPLTQKQEERPITLIKPYLIRFIFTLLTMEVLIHTMYVVAIKDARPWEHVTYLPSELALLSFFSLIHVWLKLLIPWRFFRLWSLLAGIDPPENMVRCMANNYSALAFWRAWHRSFNLWIVRYIYIPLGGSHRQLLNSLLIFTFVALWHDLTFRLLAWGWLVSIFLIPEVVAGWVFSTGKFGDRPWYRHLCALGAVLNILMMMAANLVGFVIGTDGVRYFVEQLVGTKQGATYALSGFMVSADTFQVFNFLHVQVAGLFVGVQFMFEYREEEKRRGIYRRC